MIHISVKVVTALGDYAKSISDKVTLSEAMWEVGDVIRKIAYYKAPVLTGALRESLAVTTKYKSDISERIAASSQLRPNEEFHGVSTPPDGAVDVHATIRYAGYVEHGTSRNAAQPFLYPAAKELTGEDIVGILRQYLDPDRFGV